MKTIKQIITSSKEIIITYILSYLIIIIISIIYKYLGKTNQMFLSNNILIPILLIYYLLTSIYLYQKNKYPNHQLKTYFPFISQGITISTTFNMLLFKLVPPAKTTTTTPFYLNIIASGIIGPIYEEILFRYLLFNRLKHHFSLRKAIITSTLVFALIHLLPIKIIYAFILGLILTFTYHKSNNILVPILIHIFANTTAIFLTEYNFSILALSLLNIIILVKIFFFQNKSIKSN